MKKLYIATAFAGFFLLIANSGYWVNRYVFNAQKFSEIAVDSILSTDSRQAIATGVATKIYEDRPVAAKFLTDPTANIVDGILGSPRMVAPLTELVQRINTRMTSKSQPEVALDLSSVKAVLNQVMGVAENVTNKDANFSLNNVPDKIVILQANDLPSLYNYSVAILWLSPITMIAGLLLMVLPYFWWRNRYKTIMTTQAIMLLSVGAVAEMIGPLFRPLVIGGLQTDAGRTVVGNLYNAFLTTFNHQSAIFFVLGGLLLIARVLVHFEIPKKTKQAFASVRSKSVASPKAIDTPKQKAKTTAKPKKTAKRK